jgi:hypothetical protein
MPWIDVGEVRVIDIRILLYKEMIELLNENIYVVNYTINQKSFLLLNDCNSVQPAGHDDFDSFLDSYKDAIFSSVRAMSKCNKCDISVKSEIFPFKESYFFDREEIVFIVFEIDLNKIEHNFAIAFSIAEFENMYSDSISA